MSGSRWWWCLPWLGLYSVVVAEPYEPLPTVEAVAPLALSLPSPTGGLSLSAMPLLMAPAEPRSAWTRLSVVELPPETVPGIGPQRRHHALRFGLDAPRTWLRGMGLDTSECLGQVRAPSKLRAGTRGDGVTYEAQIQFRLQCQY